MSGLTHINDEYIVIFRLKTHGNRFELLCRREEVYRFFTDDNRLLLSVVDDDNVLAKILQKPTIFFHAKKKEIATHSSLQQAFGESATVREIILQILSKGDIVETQRDRDASKHNVEAVKESVLKLLPQMLLNPFSGVHPEEFEVRDAVGAVISKWKPLAGVPLIVEAGYVASQIAQKIDCVRVAKKIVFSYPKSRTKAQVAAWNDFILGYSTVVTSFDSQTVAMSKVASADATATATSKPPPASQPPAIVQRAPSVAFAEHNNSTTYYDSTAPPTANSQATSDREKTHSIMKSNRSGNEVPLAEPTKAEARAAIKSQPTPVETAHCDGGDNTAGGTAEPVTFVAQDYIVRETLIVDATLLTSTDPTWEKMCETFALPSKGVDEAKITEDEVKFFSSTLFDAPVPAMSTTTSATSSGKYNHDSDVPTEVAALNAARQREIYNSKPDSIASVVLNRQVGDAEVVFKGNKKGSSKKIDSDFSDEDVPSGKGKGKGAKGGKKGSSLGNNSEDLEAEFSKKTHKELQELCKKKGMSTGGKKEDLVDRLVSFEENR